MIGHSGLVRAITAILHPKAGNPGPGVAVEAPVGALAGRGVGAHQALPGGVVERRPDIPFRSPKSHWIGKRF